jgi:alpha-maltose-1-phosphate synthase
VAQVLPADVRHHLRALAECRLLRKAHTGYAYQSQRWLERAGRTCDALFGLNLSQRLATRPEIDGVPKTCIDDAWVTEVLQQTFGGKRGKPRRRTLLMDRRQAYLSARAARRLRKDDRLVLAREDEALELFRAAAKLGVPRVYQLPIAHYATVERIFQREIEEFPDHDLRTSREISMAPTRVARKDGELALASKILVPSLFVKQSLLDAHVDEARIHVLPFGSEPDWNLEAPATKNPQLFLHVGQLSIRKGTHRLLHAWKRLGGHRSCKLRLIGSMQLDEKFLQEFQGVYEYIGKVPRRSLRQHYAEASCFVLPSLAEGFAVVLLESLSCGTPIIASRNSGAEGFITHGQEGLLHDAQNDDQLCEALDWMLSHPQQRIKMVQRCLNKARSWTWHNYRAAFSSFISGLLSCKNGRSSRQSQTAGYSRK